MKAGETTVLRLLQGSKVFLIPNFQRRYSWRKPQWEDLWEDLVREYESEHDQYSQELDGHFLGSVVLHPAPGPASTLMRHLVIDGQQRLTTLLVILAALRDVRREVDPTWNPASYDAKYLTNPFDDEYPDRLVPTEFDREPYVQTVRHGNPTGGIGQAYTFYRALLQAAHKDGLDLGRLGDVLLIHLVLVEINTSTGDSVNNIFNTLNSKGLPLSATDLVRNELLLNLDERTAAEAYRNVWLPMEKDLVRLDAKGNPNDSMLVTFFWAREVVETPSTTKKNLFQSFERRLRKLLDGVPPSGRQEVVLEYFAEIHGDERLFKAVLNPVDGDMATLRGEESLRAVLEDLRRWGSEPYLPIALWVMREVHDSRVTADDATQTLRVLLGYLVRRALFGLPTNNLNRLLSAVPGQLASRRTDASATAAVTEILSRTGYRWPSDADVLLGVQSQPIYLSVKRAQTHFLLQAIERAASGKEYVDTDDLTIEHILPQSLPLQWIEYLEGLGESIEEAESVIHTMGNLTLTGYNSELSDDAFTAKQAELKDSPLRMNIGIAALNEWTVSRMRERSREMAGSLLPLLPGPPRGDSIVAAEDRDRELREDLQSALQVLPEGAWTTDAELVKLLGATADALHALVNQCGPETVRLVRSEDGRVPDWLGLSLRDKVLRQSPEEFPSAGLLGADRIAELLHAGSSEGEQSEVLLATALVI